MKNYYLIISLLCTYALSAQSVDQFKKIAAGINTSFTDFEIVSGNSSNDRETNFGLEKRAYEFDTFNVLAYEKDDVIGIDEIVILSKKEFDNKEAWYKISKELSGDSKFTQIESFVSSIKDHVYKKNLKFNDLVDVLRNARDMSDYIYYVVFKKDNKYYQMNVVEEKTLLKISKSYQSTINK
jgi:hypothetical protein